MSNMIRFAGGKDWQRREWETALGYGLPDDGGPAVMGDRSLSPATHLRTPGVAFQALALE